MIGIQLRKPLVTITEKAHEVVRIVERNTTNRALTHQWEEWLVTKAATCHASGLNERFCTLCGDKEQQTIEQLTHDYSDYVIVSGNKLIPPIVREKTCNLCDDVQTYEDWSNVWTTIVAGIAIVGVIIGLVNYVRAFKKR